MNDVGIASYADGSTLFFVGDDLNDVILKFQKASKHSSNGLMKAKWKLTQVSVILFVALA